MDFQHRAGGKTGTGGVSSWSETNRDRRECLRQLALETIDLNKDPYFMKNHLGSYECKLCLTLHNNEGSYLAHTQGKKHQANLARRAAKEAKDSPQQPAPAKPRVDIKRFVKIGRPGYRVTKQRERETGHQSLLFQIDYPEIGEGIAPRHRFMSAYEQKVEPPGRRWQYLLFAAEPYETIAFKVPSREVTLIIGWAVSSTSCLAVLFATYSWSRGRTADVAESVTYALLHRTAWAGGVAWVLFVCATGHGSVLNKFLSWQLFTPLSRLCYSVYLLHFPVLWVRASWRRSLLHFNHYDIVTEFLGILMITLGVSVVFHLVFEAPFLKLEQIWFPERNQPKEISKSSANKHVT